MYFYVQDRQILILSLDKHLLVIRGMMHPLVIHVMRPYAVQAGHAVCSDLSHEMQHICQKHLRLSTR